MSDEPTPFRVHTYGEMAELVPYLLGFEPSESLVALVIENRQVQVTARVDLACAALCSPTRRGSEVSASERGFGGDAALVDRLSTRSMPRRIRLR